ncbi:MAG: hypothetical protein MZV63_28675 [Marinilabiliales bacterium]|nr:hypothetical protein [Marinilabiliales bacterium]
MNDLKKLVFDLIRSGDDDLAFHEDQFRVIKNLFREAKIGQCSKSRPG